jgi:hypothetical protein
VPRYIPVTPAADSASIHQFVSPPQYSMPASNPLMTPTRAQVRIEDWSTNAANVLLSSTPSIQLTLYSLFTYAQFSLPDAWELRGLRAPRPLPPRSTTRSLPAPRRSCDLYKLPPAPGGGPPWPRRRVD